MNYGGICEKNKSNAARLDNAAGLNLCLPTDALLGRREWRSARHYRIKAKATSATIYPVVAHFALDSLVLNPLIESDTGTDGNVAFSS
jgi:hypothetical protein